MRSAPRSGHGWRASTGGAREHTVDAALFHSRAAQDGLTKLFGERKPKVRRALTDLQAFGVVLSFGLAATGVAAFALLAWLAWESHEFGDRDLRYLVFVRGTLLERVGAIDVQPGTVVYGGQGRDGTASGLTSARYSSSVEGQVVLGHFAERCKAVGLHVTMREPEAGETFRIATCGRTANDEFPVGINVRERQPDRSRDDRVHRRWTLVRGWEVRAAAR